MTIPILSPDLQPFYEERLHKWACKKCNHIIRGNLSNHKESCIGLSNKKKIALEKEKMTPFYRIEDKQWFCLKCNCDIKSKRRAHYNSCVGLGTLVEQKNIFSGFNPDCFSKVCDMGCGNKSNFYYKTGKAYCCKLGAKCPVKVAKDKEKKDGINPFEINKIPHPRGMLGKIPHNKGKKGLVVGWNKGMTGLKGTPHTEETKKRMSEIAKKSRVKGYFHGGGKGKQGRYKGMWCDSSWELAYILYCEDNNIQIERYGKSRTYVFENKTRIYWPDFLVEGVIVEIKGYKSPEWEAKHLANPDIKVLSKQEMTPILKYVKAKYGNDFIKLYESTIKPGKRSNEEEI